MGAQAEPTGPNVVGDLYVSAAGVLYSCTVAGTPGTWAAVGAGGGTGAFGGVVTNYTANTTTAESETLVTIPVATGAVKTVIITASCVVTDVTDGVGGTYSGIASTSRTIISPAGTLLYRGAIWDIIVNSGAGGWVATADITANALTVQIEQTNAALTNIDWDVRVEIVSG